MESKCGDYPERASSEFEEWVFKLQSELHWHGKVCVKGLHAVGTFEDACTASVDDVFRQRSLRTAALST